MGGGYRILFGWRSATKKMNDFDQDRAPRAISWGKPGPRFDFTLTAE